MRPAVVLVVGVVTLYLLWSGKAIKTWKALTA